MRIAWHASRCASFDAAKILCLPTSEGISIRAAKGAMVLRPSGRATKSRLGLRSLRERTAGEGKAAQSASFSDASTTTVRLWPFPRLLKSDEPGFEYDRRR